MTPNEINQKLKEDLEIYISALDAYSDEQFTKRKDEETWSLGQMYEHIVLASNGFFLGNVLRCLEKRKGQEGGEMNKYGVNALKHNGLPPMKFKVPGTDKAPDLEVRSRAEYKDLLQKIINDAEGILPTLEADNGTYKTLHPVFDWLNAVEWFQMLEIHTRHHFRQKEELEA